MSSSIVMLVTAPSPIFADAPISPAHKLLTFLGSTRIINLSRSEESES